MRLILLVFSAVSVGGCQASERGLRQDETFLTVTATGRAEARPDEARLSLGVQSQGASAAEASRANREKMDRVTTALARLGVQGDDLQTRNLSLQRIDYGPERGRFRADNVVNVRLRDMARVGEAVAAATEAGANLLGGPELGVADPEAATRAAYSEAYRAARARAEAYGQAADMEIARVLAIYDGGDRGQPPAYPQSVDASGVAPPPPVARAAMPEEQTSVPFSAGLNRAQVSVRVDFALVEK